MDYILKDVVITHFIIKKDASTSCLTLHFVFVEMCLFGIPVGKQPLRCEMSLVLKTIFDSSIEITHQSVKVCLKSVFIYKIKAIIQESDAVMQVEEIIASLRMYLHRFLLFYSVSFILF